MSRIGKWTAAVAVSGVVALGAFGYAGAQSQTPPGVDAAQVADELGLTGDQRDAVVARLQELNDVLAREAQLRSEAEQLRADFSQVFTALGSELTPEQQRILREELRGALGGRGGHMGPAGAMGMGRMGAHMGSRGAGRGPGACSGPDGAGPMGSMMGMGAGMHRGGFFGFVRHWLWH